MNSKIWVYLVVCSLFLFPSIIYSADRTNKISLEISGGWIASTKGSDSLFGRTSVGINLSNYLSFDIAILSSFAKTGPTLISADAFLNLLPQRKTIPFFILGGGIGIIDRTGETSTKALFNAGGGVQHFFTEDLALRLDLRSYILTGQTDWTASAGLVFYFDPVFESSSRSLKEASAEAGEETGTLTSPVKDQQTVDVSQTKAGITTNIEVKQLPTQEIKAKEEVQEKPIEGERLASGQGAIIKEVERKMPDMDRVEGAMIQSGQDQVRGTSEERDLMIPSNTTSSVTTSESGIDKVASMVQDNTGKQDEIEFGRERVSGSQGISDQKGAGLGAEETLGTDKGEQRANMGKLEKPAISEAFTKKDNLQDKGLAPAEFQDTKVILPEKNGKGKSVGVDKSEGSGQSAEITQDLDVQKEGMTKVDHEDKPVALGNRKTVEGRKVCQAGEKPVPDSIVKNNRVEPKGSIQVLEKKDKNSEKKETSEKSTILREYKTEQETTKGSVSGEEAVRGEDAKVQAMAKVTGEGIQETAREEGLASKSGAKAQDIEDHKKPALDRVQETVQDSVEGMRLGSNTMQEAPGRKAGEEGSPANQQIFKGYSDGNKKEVSKVGKKSSTGIVPQSGTISGAKVKRADKFKKSQEKRSYERAKMYGEAWVKDSGIEETETSGISSVSPGVSKDKRVLKESVERKDYAVSEETERAVPLKIMKNRIELTIEFGLGEIRLSQSNQDLLFRFIEKIKETRYNKILIEGHACAHGEKKLNLIISKKRALSVKEFLVRYGVKGNIILRFYGEERLRFKEIPTPENINDPHVKANRRVVIKAVR